MYKEIHSSVIREILIKIKRYYFTIIRLAKIRKIIISNVGENVVETGTMVGGQSRRAYFLAQYHPQHNAGETLAKDYSGTQMNKFIRAVYETGSRSYLKGQIRKM